MYSLLEITYILFITQVRIKAKPIQRSSPTDSNPVAYNSALYQGSMPCYPAMLPMMWMPPSGMVPMDHMVSVLPFSFTLLYLVFFLYSQISRQLVLEFNMISNKCIDIIIVLYQIIFRTTRPKQGTQITYQTTRTWRTTATGLLLLLFLKVATCVLF